MSESDNLPDITRSTGKLAEALAKAQGMMENAREDAENPHFRSRYASLASVWDACRKALTSNGLAVAQILSTDGAKLTVKTALLHTSGERLEGSFTVVAKDSSPQSIGSAATYARRYSLAAMVGVAPSDDDGNDAQPGPPPPPQKRQPPALKKDVRGFDPLVHAHADWLEGELRKRGIDESTWEQIAKTLRGRPASDFETVLKEVIKHA